MHRVKLLYMAERTKPTLKQDRFARAYVVEGNGAEAAIQAGYRVKDRKIASAVATENLEKPVVQHAIKTWQERLQASVLPSLDTIEKLRDTSEDDRIRLAASRDLLNRAGIGKNEAKTNVLAVFANLDENVLLERLARLGVGNSANVSQNDVSANIQCATQEKNDTQTADGVPGFGDAAAV